MKLDGEMLSWILKACVLAGTENDIGQRVMPSNAFCRAVDAEPEMDAIDAFAEGLSYSRREQLPSRQMEVSVSLTLLICQASYRFQAELVVG